MLSGVMLAISTSEYVVCLLRSNKIKSKILNINLRMMPITK